SPAGRSGGRHRARGARRRAPPAPRRPSRREGRRPESACRSGGRRRRRRRAPGVLQGGRRDRGSRRYLMDDLPVQRPFRQVDVFTTTPYAGNPVAVVLEAEGLSTEQMVRFTRWTNLSEAAFVLPPADPAADYRVRIFTG